VDRTDFVGKKGLFKNESLEIVAISNFMQDKKDYLVTLNNGKKFYLLKGILNDSIKFIDVEIQNRVENYIISCLTCDLQSQTTDSTQTEQIKDIDTLIAYVIENAKKIIYKKISERNISTGYESVTQGLIVNKEYGSKAQDIYERCCDSLNFDYKKIDCFAPRQLLFATKAAPGGYDVWFLPHSNLNVSNTPSWTNIYCLNGDIIYELWHVEDDNVDKNDRLTFIKQGNGDYVFLGVYRLEKKISIGETIGNLECKKIKIYKRVSTEYIK